MERQVYRRKQVAKHCEIASNRLLELADKLSRNRSTRVRTNAQALYVTYRLLRAAELEILDAWQLYEQGGGRQ